MVEEEKNDWFLLPKSERGFTAILFQASALSQNIITGFLRRLLGVKLSVLSERQNPIPAEDVYKMAEAQVSVFPTIPQIVLSQAVKKRSFQQPDAQQGRPKITWGPEQGLIWGPSFQLITFLLKCPH